MKSRNTILQLAVVAAFAGATSMAQAALSVPAAAVQIANELPTTGTALVPNGAAFAIGSTSTAFTPSAAQALQVTVTLDSGAKFTTNPTMTCDFVSAIGPNTSANVSMVMNYGGAGLQTAVFTISNTAILAVVGDTGSVLSCTAGVTALSVTGTHAAIGATMSYQYGSIATLTKTGPYLTYVKSVSAGIVPGVDAVAQVSGGFVSLTGGALLLSAGVVNYTSNASGLGVTGGQFDLSSGSIVSASLTVQGAALSAVSATGGVYLVSAAGTCVLANGITGSVVGNSITFAGLTAATVTAGLTVCAQFNGTSAIAAGPITATWAVTPTTGYSADATMSSSTLVNITHNGTTLIAPLSQTPTGFISRMVISNSGPAAAYSVTTLSETGNTATVSGAALSGTAGANSQTVVDLPSLVTYTAGKSPRTALSITVAGTTANINGLYQIVAPNGAVSNYVMVKQ